MKRIALFLCLCTLSAVCTAQRTTANAKSRHLTYNVYEYGDTKDTSHIYIETDGAVYWIIPELPQGFLVPGYGQEYTQVDFDNDTVTHYLKYHDSTFFYGTTLSRNDIEWRIDTIDRHQIKYTCSINSNKMEFLMDESSHRNITPLCHYDRLPGVLTAFWRNGQMQMQLAQADNSTMTLPSPDISRCRKVTPRQMSQIKNTRLILTTRIFDDEQLCWGKTNTHIIGDIPFDSVMHFAGGTVIVKRVHLPQLPSHYQTFVELHQKSNGDAYDRTGCVFIVPTGCDTTFFAGLNHHPDSLPLFYGKDGQRYQGIRLTTTKEGHTGYEPIVELMRFFTPFGVGHFNQRLQIDGLTWASESYYKQEITDLSDRISGDVLIGAFIGNYDGGGHKITMDIKSYPGSELWAPGKETAFCTNPNETGITDSVHTHSISLFNTCNVLEMAGQNYGKLFAQDSLTVSFNLPEGCTNVRLRYISTGHGGWEGGDEFNPKTNTILIDGKITLTHTPWREDCGCYREKNPVSGNFWNGMSSSDYSRSGWCPGTATQPTYFYLTDIKPGRHTITVAIPQGAPLDGSFSYWNVSGLILYEQ